MIDDAELLRRYSGAGLEEAFAELVRRHLSFVYHAALRQFGGDIYRAEDATQLVFMMLARKASSLVHHSNLVGWLYRTTHFTVNNLRRDERRRRIRETEAHMMHEILRDSSARVDWDRLRPILDDVMQNLGELDRDVLLARFFENRSFRQIGARIALTEDAARMRVERALEKLRISLVRRGVNSTAAALGALMTSEASLAAPVGLAASVTGAALAHAGIAAPVAGLFQFMSTTKFVTSVAGVALLLFVGFAMREARAHREIEAALQTTILEAAASEKSQRELNQRLLAAERDADQLQANIDEALAANAAAATRRSFEINAANIAAARKAAWDPNAEGKSFLARHPEFKQALVDRSRARVNFNFLSLYRALNLTPQQIDELENVLIEAEGVDMGSPEMIGQLKMKPGVGLTAEEMDRRVRGLLGEAGYALYREAVSSIPDRPIVSAVANTVQSANAPLTASQADQLARIFMSSRTDPTKPWMRQYDWDAVLAKSREIMSAPQMAALEGMQQQDRFNRALRQAAQSQTSK